MASGTVAFFNERKGYGFIESDDADEDVFFHMEDVGGPDLEKDRGRRISPACRSRGPLVERSYPSSAVATALSGS